MNEALIKDPKDRKSLFRKMLIAKLGSIEDIIKVYDSNGNGDVSFTEFETATKKVLSQADLENYMLLSGLQQLSLKRIFSLFDESGDGTIDTVELVAFKSTDLVQAEWESLSVMQKWKLYCKKTHAWDEQGGLGDQRVVKKKNVEIERMLERNIAEDKREIGKKRIRELFRLGERNAFKLAPFFRKGLKGKEMAQAKILGTFSSEILIWLC